MIKYSKRLFVGLLGFSLLLFAALLLYVWQAVFTNDPQFMRSVLITVLIVMAVIIAIAAAAVLTLVFTLLKGKRIPVLEPLAERTVHLLFPLTVAVARLFQIAQEKVQRSFIAVNNQLVTAAGIKAPPEKLLLLLPHCLQWSECPYRVTRHPENCRRCGRCPLAAVLNLADEFGLPVSIVTGGTLARQEVKKIRPKAIVAVACERDLTSGIIDSRPLPVFGVLNERPNGPCYNTNVDISRLREGILKLLEKNDATVKGV